MASRKDQLKRQLLAKAMLESGMSRSEVAKQAEISTHTVHKLVNTDIKVVESKAERVGLVKHPSVKAIAKQLRLKAISKADMIVESITPEVIEEAPLLARAKSASLLKDMATPKQQSTTHVNVLVQQLQQS